MSTPQRQLYENTARDAARRYGVPERLVFEQITAESNWNPNAVSSKGAIGIYQMKLETARSIGVDPRDPIASIYGGVRLMRSYFDRFKSWALALAAYHSGPNDAEAALRNPAGNPKTHSYVNTILQRAGIADAANPTPETTDNTLPEGITNARGISLPGIGQTLRSPDFKRVLIYSVATILLLIAITRLK